MQVNNFLVMSDLHFQQCRNKSYINEFGISSWLQTQLDVTEDIFQYAIKYDIEDVYCNGDVFENKNNITQGVYNIVWSLFKKYSKKLNIILNTGNHDIFKVDRDSSLTPFTDIITVITKPSVIENIKFIPFGMTEGELKSNSEILFLHEEVEGIVEGFESNKLILLKDIVDYKVVFNGHIHKPKDIHNVINVGSTVPNDWGEAGQQKRFVHYHDGIIDSININHPTWNTLNEIPEDFDDKYNFYRINISSDELSHSIFKKYNVFPNITKLKKRVSRIKQTGNINNQIIQYIELKNTNLDKDRLFKVGKLLLK